MSDNPIEISLTGFRSLFISQLQLFDLSLQCFDNFCPVSSFKLCCDFEGCELDFGIFLSLSFSFYPDFSFLFSLSLQIFDLTFQILNNFRPFSIFSFELFFESSELSLELSIGLAVACWPLLLVIQVRLLEMLIKHSLDIVETRIFDLVKLIHQMELIRSDGFLQGVESRENLCFRLESQLIR